MIPRYINLHLLPGIMLDDLLMYSREHRMIITGTAREDADMAGRTSIHVASDREGLIATSNVSAVRDFSAEVARGQERPQSRDAGGVAQWHVEVTRSVESWGDRHTEVVQVLVPSPTRPQVVAGPIQFSGLTAVVSVNRGGTLAVYWSAEGIIEAAAPASRRGAE